MSISGLAPVPYQQNTITSPSVDSGLGSGVNDKNSKTLNLLPAVQSPGNSGKLTALRAMMLQL